MAGDDLVTHGKADARSAVLGAALIKLFLYMGKLGLWNAAPVIPHGDPDALALLPNGDLHLFPLAAVLGGVVQQVQKDLLQPLRIAGDQRDLRLGRDVFQLHARLTQQLPIGEHGVLQLRGDVQQLNAQIEAPVLDAGKLQQLHHHAGEPLGLPGDDLDAAKGIPLHSLVIGDGLRPAGDGGERCAQLVRDLGDELRSGLFGRGGLLGDVVDGLGQLADLVRPGVFHLAAVAAVGNGVGKLGQAFDGVGHISPEPEQQRDDGKAGQHDHGAGHGIVLPGDAPDGDQQQHQRADAGHHQLVA